MKTAILSIGTSAGAVPFDLILVAGGTGSRAGGDIPKQYQVINGKPLIRHTLDRILALPGLRNLRIVIHPDHDALYRAAVHGLNLPLPVMGGNTRKESVFNGLAVMPEAGHEAVLMIHDAARPFVDAGVVSMLAGRAAETGAATPGLPVADTLCRNDGSIVDRAGVYAIQTPQAFHAGLIRRAHAEFRDRDDFTDDAGMVTALGHAVDIVPGTRQNFKITTADDFDMADAMMKTQTQTESRTGFGFDVHALTPPGGGTGSIILGGVAIPFDRSLIGHSDADVGLHALTDALLSTIAAGDIGTHFPPSDPQWKGADSTMFLAHAAELVHQQGGVITLLDLTFLCEAPKIGPHRDAMADRIHAVTSVPKNRISIKATTTEKLGFTGRGEGIAAQAVASVRFPIQDA